MPCCHSALLIAPQCSFARTSLIVAVINQVKPHTTFLTLDSPSHALRGRFSWQRGLCSSWRRKPIYQQEYSLPIKAINKNWSKSPPKHVSSSQKGGNVADTGLTPPCWYKLCRALSSEHRGESCSDPQKSDSSPHPWQPLLSHTQIHLCKVVLPQIRPVQAAVGLEHSPLLIS